MLRRSTAQVHPQEKLTHIDHKERCILKEKSKSMQENKMSMASSFGSMLENVREKAVELNLWNDDMQRDLPKKWEKHGNMIVFPQNSFQHNNWRFIGRELWSIVAASLEVERLGRKRLIANDSDRTPHVDILYGSNGWVEHIDERGVRYIYDASKKVFDISKAKEMSRISQLDAHGETIVNLMAGLGYYTFPWVVSSGAKHVFAIDWDEDSCEALLRTSTANMVEDKVTVLQGDARRIAPTAKADRVYLGILPSSKAHWMTACKCLKEKGGWLHIQELVDPQRNRMERTDSTQKQAENKLKKLESVDEHSEAAQPTASTQTVVDENGNKSEAEGVEAPKIKRRLSRSASIVEEMENRIIPEPIIEKEFQEGDWKKVQQHIKGFVLDVAESCCRFMNNIHVVDGTFFVEIRGVNTIRARTTARPQDHIVVDIFCWLKPEDPRPRRRKMVPRRSTSKTPPLEEEESTVDNSYSKHEEDKSDV